MNKYRTHNCNELRTNDLDKEISISGWINKKRDHGNLLFIDLRDNYGITQCIIDKDNKNFLDLEKIQLETVIKVSDLYLFNYSPKASFIILKSIGFFRFKLILSILYMKSKILPYDLSILLIIKSINFLSIDI